MATSYKFYKQSIKKYLIDRFPEDATILDVGAGEGTYYNLLHDYFLEQSFFAVEVFKPNIEKYNLESKYKKVINADIKDLEYSFYDIIIFGDVLEHLEVDEAQKVLEYAYNRCNELIVAVPYEMPQGIAEDNVYEIHKQDDLTPEIMLERYPMLKLLHKNTRYGYYVKDVNYGKN